MKKLEDTINLMNSSDYKERFMAEYWQTKIRYEKLKVFNNKIEAAQLTRFSEVDNKVKEPKHDCPADILKEQQTSMGNYLHLLEIRAVMENIDLNQVFSMNKEV